MLTAVVRRSDVPDPSPHPVRMVVRQAEAPNPDPRPVRMVVRQASQADR